MCSRCAPAIARGSPTGRRNPGNERCSDIKGWLGNGKKHQSVWRMNDDLKPCPFCGDPEPQEASGADGEDHWVLCGACGGMSGVEGSAVAAAVTWNKRVTAGRDEPVDPTEDVLSLVRAKLAIGRRISDF